MFLRKQTGSLQVRDKNVSHSLEPNAGTIIKVVNDKVLKEDPEKKLFPPLHVCWTLNRGSINVNLLLRRFRIERVVTGQDRTVTEKVITYFIFRT